jgi:hypothetical protein
MFVAFGLVLGCSRDAADGGWGPSDATDGRWAPSDAADATHTRDAPLPDGIVDVSIGSPDVVSPDAATPTDGSDVTEPSIDVTGNDGVSGDGTPDDVTSDGEVADGSRDADASADRCRSTGLRLNAWAGIASFQADGGGDVDVSGDAPADARVNDVADDAPPARDGAADGSSDAPVDVLARCNALQMDWRAFVLQNRDCTVASECTVVGGAGACDCIMPGLGRPIGNGSGDAIAVAARTAALVRLDQWHNLGCHFVAGCIYDAGPAKNLRCEQGKCTADYGGCNQPPPPEPCR